MPVEVKVRLLQVAVLLATRGFGEKHLGGSKPCLQRPYLAEGEFFRLAHDFLNIQGSAQGRLVS